MDKKIYEAPALQIVASNDGDVISASSGDTPLVDAFDW